MIRARRCARAGTAVLGRVDVSPTCCDRMCGTRPLAIAAVVAALGLTGALTGEAEAQILGTAESFGVLAGSTATNTGSSVIQGNVGVSPGGAVVGFPPGIVVAPGVIHAADAVAGQAQVDLTTAYNTLQALPSQVSLTGQNLGGMTLGPAVYSFATSAQLTGLLTLNGQGNSASQFVFQIGSTLTTASNSAVLLINGANGNNVYWAVGSSATLGTNTAFAGNIVALTSITLNTGATLTCGRALARNGAVTLDSNTITLCAAPGPGQVQVQARGQVRQREMSSVKAYPVRSRPHSARPACLVRQCWHKARSGVKQRRPATTTTP